MAGFGFTELLIVLGIALFIFGPTKLPALGKSIGEAIKGFKKGLHEEPVKKIEK
ncbi:MAG: twin-arginine translocase TatA/TatE family subunit [bacterium]